ncbi:hypothetical protein E2562_011415 [Oryza meyeriana var. granulata]|uniref:DNA polymerase alpha catalytic subunit N-terminal domain-containing protein n=1 Tax=Oryza meyeriana var. granulata TaxID=110450 RepID=A0A6G1D260_9ORYZ|nr:hypothetical protein E2562_011415 [Oryza meyeriana var. granulata]
MVGSGHVGRAASRHEQVVAGAPYPCWLARPAGSHSWARGLSLGEMRSTWESDPRHDDGLRGLLYGRCICPWGSSSCRSWGSEAVARSTTLERLAAIRRGGARAATAIQVKMESPIYDTVTEEDNAALVAGRRKDAGAFIVDDDGQEEDWKK